MLLFSVAWVIVAVFHSMLDVTFSVAWFIVAVFNSMLDVTFLLLGSLLLFSIPCWMLLFSVAWFIVAVFHSMLDVTVFCCLVHGCCFPFHG